MAIKSMSKVANEGFVYGVVTDSEKRLMDRLDEMDTKNQERFDKMMTQVVDIARQFKKFDEERVLMSDKIRDHSDQIEDLQEMVYAN